MTVVLPSALPLAWMGHVLHVVVPVASLYWPALQAAHEPALPPYPLLQMQPETAAVAVSAVVEPGGQVSQFEAGLSKYLPTTHAVHVSLEDRMIPEYPGPHLQSVDFVAAGSVDDESVGHAMQSAVPSPVLYCPASQAVQLSPAAFIVPLYPGAQRHADAAVLPADSVFELVGHAVQEAEAAASAY